MIAQILLVEDDPISRTMIKGFLESRGYAVDAVDDGVGGIRLLRHGRYDLVLVDYHLPEIDGYMSARLMRDLSADGGPKLAAITADHRGLVTRTAGDAVFDGILAKPITPQALFDFVANMLAEPVESPVSRAAAAFLKMPRHELGRQAAAAFWRERGLPGCPRAAVLPTPRLDQIEALSLCFDLREPPDAELILLLDPSGLDRLAALRDGGLADFAPAVDAGVGDEAACEAAFRVDDPASWSQIAALIEGFASRRALLHGAAAEVPRDPDLRFLRYLFLADHPLRIVHGEAGGLRLHGAGGFRRDGVIGAVNRLEGLGRMIRRAGGEGERRVDLCELSDLGRAAVMRSDDAAEGVRPPVRSDPVARILLAIETPVNRDITASMLTAVGYVVDTAGSAAETIAALDRRVFRLVVMDARMRDAEATGLARRIRERPEPQGRVPIIVLSASAGPAEVAVLQGHGVDAVLRRPFRSHELYEHVERLAPHHRAPGGGDLVQVEFDQTVFDSLLDFMDAGNRRFLLETLVAQIEAIPHGRDETEAHRSALAADAHAMISAAGMLGFGGLSTSCRLYCDAVREGRPVDAEALRAACAATKAYIAALPGPREVPSAAKVTAAIA